MNLKPGTIHIEMSTIDVDRKARLRDQVRARGGDLLDCPISGSPGMVAPRLATTFASGDKQSVDAVSAVLDAISGPWIYTGPFGTGAQMKYVANLLLAVHTVAAAEAMALARRSGLDLQLVQKTLDDSIASSAIWKQRGPLMAERAWTPAPGPVSTLHPILEQIEEHAASTGLSASVFAAAKEVFDKALADGWGDLDIACVHDQVEPDDLVAGQLRRRRRPGLRGAARGRRARRAGRPQALAEHPGACWRTGPRPKPSCATWMWATRRRSSTTRCSRRCSGRAR